MRCKLNEGLWMGSFLAATKGGDYGLGHFRPLLKEMIIVGVIS